MVLICNICNQNIENNSYYIFDKIHCSIKCKNIYKGIMEEKNLGPNELYYERNYINTNKKNNSFNDLKIKKRLTLNKNSKSLSIFEKKK
jgi:hypothetical protein